MITQLCLGAYLYSAGTQYRNLLKLLVMTSMVICHQKIKDRINTAEIYKQKPLVILKKTHLFQSFTNNLYRTHLIWSNKSDACTKKLLHPSFLKSQMQLVFMAVHSRYDRHYLKDILCSTDLWRGWGSEEFTLPHLLQDMVELVHINRGGAVFSYSSEKLTGAKSGEWAARTESGMTRALWGVALLSCKVWHLVPWLAEHIGWGGTHSHPCSVGQLG